MEDFILSVLVLAASIRHHVTPQLATTDYCSVRYEYRNIVGVYTKWVCERSACKKPLRITYVNSAPYVFKVGNDSTPRGLFVDVLKEGFQSCCPGCFNITKWIHLDSFREIEKHFNETTIFLPVSMPEDPFTGTEHIHSMPFVGLIKTPRIVFAELHAKDTTSEQLSSVVAEVAKLWPLFALTVLTTLAAGVCIWLMDTWFNRADFPRSFFSGAGEGSWWAFVSMTTVGYGDKTPRSFHARMFAVVWILFGIAISSILTASLSTALTTVAMTEPATMRGKKICVHYAVSVEHTTVLQNGGDPQVYTNISDIEKAIYHGKCEGVAMESNSFLFHTDLLMERNDLKVRSVIPTLERSIGVLFTDINYDNGTNRWSTFLPSFFHYNRDHKEAMLAEAVKRLPKKLRQEMLKAKATDVNIFDSKSSYFTPMMTSIGTILAVLCLAGISIEVTRHYKKSKSRKRTSSVRSSNGSVAMKYLERQVITDKRMLDEWLADKRKAFESEIRREQKEFIKFGRLEVTKMHPQEEPYPRAIGIIPETKAEYLHRGNGLKTIM